MKSLSWYKWDFLICFCNKHVSRWTSLWNKETWTLPHTNTMFMLQSTNRRLCVCVCVLVGVNKSGGTKAHGSRSALKGCSQNRSCQFSWGTAHCPPIKKVPVCWNKTDRLNEPKIHLIIAEDMWHVGNKTNCHKNIVSVFTLSLYVNLTWPVDEVTVGQSSDLHPLQEEHGGSDVRLHNMWTYLDRKLSVLGVQTKTLAYRAERCVSDRTAAGNWQPEIDIQVFSNSLTPHLLDPPAVCDSWLDLCWLAEWWLSLFWSWGCKPVTASQCVDYIHLLKYLLPLHYMSEANIGRFLHYICVTVIVTLQMKILRAKHISSS